MLSLIVLAAGVQLQVKNDVPRFEAFYRSASRAGVTETQRWAMWKSKYGIAAVPPTPEGDALARRQLDAAWPRYAPIAPRLGALEQSAVATARTAIARIERILDVRSNLTVRLLLFVGQFDNNAFSVPAMNGNPPETVMPVEAEHRDVLLAHELTHAVHFALDGIRNSFGAPLGETIFLEGLAMRSSAQVFPGKTDADYAAEGDQVWMNRCKRRQRAVLQGVLPYLRVASAPVASRFTFGEGTVGMHRQLYCAAWLMYGHLLHGGTTLARLARVPERAMPDMTASAIREMLASGV